MPVCTTQFIWHCFQAKTQHLFSCQRKSFPKAKSLLVAIWHKFIAWKFTHSWATHQLAAKELHAPLNDSTHNQAPITRPQSPLTLLLPTVFSVWFPVSKGHIFHAEHKHKFIETGHDKLKAKGSSSQKIGFGVVDCFNYRPNWCVCWRREEENGTTW